MSHVLVVDDEPSICWSFEQFLTDAGHRVSTAATAEDGLATAEKERPDVIVLDVRLPGMDGLTALRRFRESTPDASVIVITAHGNLDTAVRAVREGAFDYLPKPFDLDRAADVVHRALESRRDNGNGRAKETETSAVRDSLIGHSPVMQDVFKQIALVASSDVPVLITGESGTGKEMVARAIHAHGYRSEKPFLPICLAALSPGLVESELFGHVKGAFTGADQKRAGLLELADGGTVLLDEIAETEPGLQVKLLRALEQREITPVGDARPRPINVRVIAATNKSLAEAIQQGSFRDDLYFRLSVFRIHLPPLRERADDIPALAQHFLGLSGVKAAGISDEAMAELQRRKWPGNVRELRNAVEHAAVLAREDWIRPEHLPAEELRIVETAASSEEELVARFVQWVNEHAADTDAEDGLYERFLALCEPALLKTVLELCNDHKAQAAELLGMHRTTLRQKLRKYGLSADAD